MDWSNILTLLISNISVGFGGWIWGRKKYNTEVKSNEIQNFDAAIAAYKKLYDEREKIYQSTIDSLTKRVDGLTEENKELRKQVMTVSNFITTYMLQTANTKKKNSVDISAITDLIKEDSNN